MLEDRIRYAPLRNHIITAEQAAALFTDGMVVGMSGFTRAGDCKAVPLALAARAEKEPLKVTLITGASLGEGVDATLANADVLARRLPFQVDPVLRKKINEGGVMFVDQHLSETVELLRSGQMGPIDIAVVEAASITEEGYIVPTTSVGNSATFAILAKQVIVEINLAHTADMEGIHDIYIPTRRPTRAPIPLMHPQDKIGVPYIQIDPAKIAGIVITNQPDSPSQAQPSDPQTDAIARHLVDFFEEEVRKGRLTKALQPLQVGIGTIANAVMQGFAKSSFEGLTIYSEVLQDSTFALFDAGKLEFASGCSMTLSHAMHDHVFDHFEKYRHRLALRTQEVSNHPEIVRRLGIIAINTALECDIYGNVNSTHVDGTHMMNGIGGSGDFARNAYLSVFVTKSLAKGGKISRVVPMVSHVDNSEHDVDVLVTEQGLADLRGLAPRERAELIIERCCHPDYRAQLRDYYERARDTRGGHTPHLLAEAFDWHLRYVATGSMQEATSARQAA